MQAMLVTLLPAVESATLNSRKDTRPVAMALSMIRDILAGQPVPTAPSLVVHSFHSHRSQVVTLA